LQWGKKKQNDKRVENKGVVAHRSHSTNKKGKTKKGNGFFQKNFEKRSTKIGKDAKEGGERSGEKHEISQKQKEERGRWDRTEGERKGEKEMQEVGLTGFVSREREPGLASEGEGGLATGASLN